MASGNRTGYGGSWELDKSDINLDYCDVGLGLKIPWLQQQQQEQQQQRQQQQRQQQQQQQQQQQSSFSWLHNRTENPSSSPTISGFPQISRFDGGRLTFTAGQRQELERQTIIYKYMMSSMPVPPELLIPLSKYPSSSSTITTTSSSSDVVRKTGVEMRYVTGRGSDPEPWRCRRTDGKKWRCSRDVAPDQKYCERHSHKGRPSRSRKPVEPPSSSSSSLSSSSLLSPSLPVTTPSVSTCSSNPIIFTPFAVPKPSSFDLPSPPIHFNALNRYPDWFMKKEVAPTTAATAAACLYPQQIGGETRSAGVDDHESCLLSRPFIDAWSLGDHGDPKDVTNTVDNENNSITTIECTNHPSSPLNSILPLTLSMSAGSVPEQHTPDDNLKDHPEIRSSLSLASHNHHHDHQPLNWMNSWISSPPGGPLAEALCLGISGAGNGSMASHSDDQLVSPHGHSTSSSTTTLG